MSIETFVRIADAIQYDGTNGDQVAGYMSRLVLSDNGTILEVVPDNWPDPTPEYTFHVGDWFCRQTGFWSEANFPTEYAPANTVAGPKGETGPGGPDGAEGPEGPQGPPGDDGAAGATAANSYLAAKTVLLPGVALLSTGTREIVVSWGQTLPNNTYGVDFLTDNTLSVGTPYTFAVKAGSKTTTGFTLQYTNNALLTLGAGVLHCIAHP